MRAASWRGLAALCLGVWACGGAAPEPRPTKAEEHFDAGEGAKLRPVREEARGAASAIPEVAPAAAGDGAGAPARPSSDPAAPAPKGARLDEGSGTVEYRGVGGLGVAGTPGLGTRGTGLGGGGSSVGVGGALGSVRGAGRGAARVEASGPARPITPLRAGKTDDHADWPAFVKYLGAWDPPTAGAGYALADLSQRVWVSVSDADGAPIPGAHVVATAHGKPVLRATTHGDGRAALYPGLAAEAPDDVVIDWHGATTHAAWAGASVDARLPVQAAIARTVPIDVAFVLDTTGSMSDEIDRIRATLGQVVAKLGGGDRPIDLRIGAVLYRDHGDEYLTRVEPLTADVGAFRRKLDDVSAGGGGDEPEALNVGLSQAVHQLQWRQDAARVAFLIADAGPHMEIDGEVPYLTSSRDAAGAGLRVHTVAASGLPQSGTLVFRQVAAVTRGQFVFIEYGGSVAATAASHGVANPEQVSANNLDQILYDRVKAEVDGWGVR